jgi:hypothetical protein
MRRFARQHALEFVARQKDGPGARLSDQEALDVAIEAQQAVRKRIRKVAVRPRRHPKK